MIRRLHEIEPPKLALPSEQSNKSEDSTTQESLAAEFKKLLERARSGVSGVRDEVTALGFALSQAISTVHQQREEIQVADDGEGINLDDRADETTGGDLGVEEVVQEVGGKECSRQGISGPATEDDESDEELVSSDLEDLGDDLFDLEGDGEEVVLEEEVVYADISDLDISGEITAEQQALAAQVVAQQTQTSQQLNNGDVSADVEELVSTESAFQRVTLGGAEEEEDVEFVDEFVDEGFAAGNAPSEMLRPDLKTKHSPGQDSQDYSTGDEDLDRFLAQYQTDSAETSESVEQEYRPSSVVGENGGNLELDRAGSAIKTELSMWRQESVVEGVMPSKDQNKELSVQLSLLRQAFESLKAQTMSQGDTKTKSSSSGVSGVGASAEPKAAQNDGAPRAARYLNRAASQKMMERIETALKEAARSRDGKTITLRLEPLQLGQVKCDVSLRDGLLHARITPQNQEVVQSVRDHSHELQSALRRLGLNVDRVTVQVLSEKDPTAFATPQGFLEGNSFQENTGNMSGKQGQTPEKSFGNKFADVTGASTSDAGIAPADHWIA